MLGFGSSFAPTKLFLMITRRRKTVALVWFVVLQGINNGGDLCVNCVGTRE